MQRQPGDLGSFEESSMASQRKRGPVAFRPHLSEGSALSIFIVILLYAFVAEKTGSSTKLVSFKRLRTTALGHFQTLSIQPGGRLETAKCGRSIKAK